jgi:regulation of enolase protein 1 (concanavalin A-like superfamily)
MYRRALIYLTPIVFGVAVILLRAQQPVAVNVLTHHNDNARTGANLAETVLTADNVSPSTFGLVDSLGPLDGQVYAQPLYVSRLSMSSGVHNVVFVATEHNSVYAFDADGTPTTPLWQVNLGPSAPQDVVNDNANATVENCLDLTPEIGITSTPAIDLATRTIYVVTKTRDAEGAFHQHVHALALEDGHELRSVEIAASLPNGDTTATFDPRYELNRPGLLLVNGSLYVAFGSHCDISLYYGWLLRYNAATLQQQAAYLTTPTGTEGAIWQSGQGPSADEAGNVYVISGNGTNGDDNVSDSFVKLSTAGTGLSLADWFTPSNWFDLNGSDSDLGSGGALLVPNTNLVVGGGKEGRFFVLDRNNLGHTTPDDSGAVQTFQMSDVAFSHQINGGPVYWDSPSGGRLYVWPSRENLKAFSFDGATFDPTPIARSAAATPARSFPGGTLSLSANGSAPGSGIVWATVPTGSSAHATVPGILRAFDAEDITRELWSSDLNPEDSVGTYAKFTPPTIANGRVYVATFSGTIQVYGLGAPGGGGGGALPAPWTHSDIGATGLSGSASYQNGTFAVRGAGADIWGASDAFHYVYQPTSGDVQITARVEGLVNTAPFAKAGVMLRQSVDAAAAFAILDVTPAGNVEFMTRGSSGQPVTWIAGASNAPPAWLRLRRAGATVTGEVSDDGSSWTVVGSTAFTATAGYIGLAVCSHDTQQLNTATFDSVAVTSDSSGGGTGLPAPWSSDDVGETTPGSASFANGTFTVSGAGGDIWGTSDGFHYVHQPVDGDAQVVARAVSLEDTHTWAKAGVMLREGLTPGAPFVILDVTPTGTIEFMTRGEEEGDVAFVSGASHAAPVWLRLLRTGTTVTGAISSDGANWTTVGSTTFVASAVEAGIIVCSHDPAALNTATFDSVAATSGGGSNGGSEAGDVVIYASDVANAHGSWSAVSDGSAAGGIKLSTTNAGAANTDNPLAAPSDYFDVPFEAQANTPYTIWLRLRAIGNDKFNDSLWVQFSDALSGGSPVYRLNTTSGLLVNLATDGTASSLVNWGWQNGAYWLSQPVTVTFAASGTHTLRVQVREDGVEVDQIVLSPSRFLATRPGGVTNDSTIVPR